MRSWGVLFFLVFIIFSCKKEEKQINDGMWLAKLKVMDNQTLPFNFKLIKTNTSYSAEIYNGEEIILSEEVIFFKDSILIKMPVFEGYLKGAYTLNRIEGSFVKEGLNRSVPFVAEHGVTSRFQSNEPSEVSISGIWETNFSEGTDDAYLGKGIFIQNDNKVTGTFRTTTGDYRFLEGVVSGDSLKLSTFDGAHAFLFTAKVTDSTLNGVFYSGNHFKEPFVAKRNEVFELPNEDNLTYLKDGFDVFDFSFPDETGKLISLSDDQFIDKPVIVQIMGTWCPNCLDETKYLTNYLNENPENEIEVVALAFEYAKTDTLAFKSINRLKDRVGVKYPILLAQYGSIDKDLAQEKLPMLNHVLSYPTTIFIDKKGEVRKIKTGFNGPATGDKFEAFKNDFEKLVSTLISE
ncbi:TlpA family protein disulfide reductase [Cellulophaga sp. HaHaR_3_176]|uniref:TlpA disulfide reductase family protein n=1 Tax=Cellulophaga sp. HaHaR_3_176 TaxID=1942464 RepID=UPI001C1F8AAB|nr:TlpA disulfide reductase family protein [Cellulophaga sp. HaHaR_3_176]QWX85492.1 TlpA family protein disulfide reductase [Cellulophaga sp. HaHaR_3_176]